MKEPFQTLYFLVPLRMSLLKTDITKIKSISATTRTHM